MLKMCVELPTRVGLLNNGTEETKGDSLRKEAFELLSKEPSINFVGNVRRVKLCLELLMW